MQFAVRRELSNLEEFLRLLSCHVSMFYCRRNLGLTFPPREQSKNFTMFNITILL